MLDPGRLDLDDLTHALEDHTDLASWWLDPATGAVHQLLDSMWDGEPVDDGFEPPDGFRRIEPIDSAEAYSDLADFTRRVRDPRARERLERAIAGRGAFRRFKDTLGDDADLRKAWFAFHDVRMARRAIQLLRDEGLVTGEAAEAALLARPDPELPGADAVDPFDLASIVAEELRALYGARLRQVLVFGSWARGDAQPDSDIDLLVVLDRVESVPRELARMDETLGRHSLDRGVVLSAMPISERDFASGRRPIVIRARAEGRRVA